MHNIALESYVLYHDDLKLIAIFYLKMNKDKLH